jgi:hypothetical protein
MALLPVGAAPPVAAAAAPSRARFSELLRAPATLPASAAATSPAVRLLQGVEQARARLDAAVSEARRGRTFSAGELLALQADAYRASQSLDLASRVVEQGAQAVRQAVGTQV